MPCRIVTPADDLITLCADTVISDFAEQLPDIRKAVILLPEGIAKVRPQITRLQECLLHSAQGHGVEALLPATITTPQQLFHKRISLAADETSRRQEQLILAHSLASHPDLFPRQNIWQMSQALIELFEEIGNLTETGLYDQQLLQQDLAKLDPQVWDDDTKKILSLWQVWETLILDKEYSVRNIERQAFLENQLLRPNEHVYLCGIDELPPHQIKWAQQLYQAQRLTLLNRASDAPLRYAQPGYELATAICGEQALPPCQDSFSQFVDATFSGSEQTALVQRAQDFAKQHPDSPVQDKLTVFASHAFEEHAWGIYLSVKRWIEEGRYERIAIISLDRKLTRRVRAIFERYGLTLEDCLGWEVSTTSSAAAVLSLLPKDKGALDIASVLSLLRSPYCEFDFSYEQRLAVVHEIERALARLSQAPKELDGLLRTLASRGQKGQAKQAVQVLSILWDGLQEMAALLDEKERPLSEYFDRLKAVMQTLGMLKRLSIDSAGKKLLNEFSTLREVATKEELCGDYRFWYSWLLYSLEKSRYVPHPAQHSILLLRPEQAKLWHTDAVVFAGLGQQALPASQQSLINENIRHELGLATQEHYTAIDFSLFRSVLENSGRILLTYASQDRGREAAPSIWLEALQEFHQCAYGSKLEDEELAQLSSSCQDDLIKQAIHSAVAEQKRPAPVAPHKTWPASISARSYKNILECPYRFFAYYCLGLKAQARPAKHWGHLQFGMSMHQSLQALHNDMAQYPGPMDKPWLPENRDYAVAIAKQIVESVFAEAAGNHYVNTYWQGLALRVVEVYIDWLIAAVKNDSEAQISSEVAEQKSLGHGLNLYGKIDLLIDRGSEQYVVDFKTGKLPLASNIDRGEDIQLSLYGLLKDDIHGASYLSLKLDKDSKKFKQHNINFEKKPYKQHALERLRTIQADYEQGAKLVAWGHENTCKYCDWQGLCRRPSWQVLEQQQ